MRVLSVFLLFSWVLLILGCGTPPTQPDDKDRLVFNEDEELLNSRVRYFDEEVPLDSAGTSLSKASPIHLKLVAEIDPPTFEGNQLHATHVTLYDNLAFVAFSTVNGAFRGGVEVVDFTNIKRSRILGQLLMRDTDVRVAAPFDGNLYLAEATDTDRRNRFESPASLEIIKLDRGNLTVETQGFDLPGFNANDLFFDGKTVFITTGTTGGGLSIFSTESFSAELNLKVEGAKAVAADDNRVVVLEGTGTRLHVFEKDGMKLTRVIETGCENFFEAKAELLIYGHWAIFSAWDCGLMMANFHTGEVRLGIPKTEGGRTVSVSRAGKYLFVANGEAGLQVARIRGTNLEVIARVAFEGSTNFAAADDNLLFIANGFGGLKILEIGK